MQHERYVEFTVANGDTVRFTEGDGVVMEEIYTRGRWKHMGTATRLNFEPRKCILTDQNGLGGVIPNKQDITSILQGICDVADASGVPHNLSNTKYGAGQASAEFTAPSGDIIRFVASDKGVEEQLMSTQTGNWATIGIATELIFNKNNRSLVDQKGLGGVLPSKNVSQLLSRIRSVAEQAGIRHNIPSEPQFSTTSSLRDSFTNGKESRGRSLRLGSVSSAASSTGSHKAASYPGAESRLKSLIICDTTSPDKLAVATSLKACEDAAVFAERIDADVRRISKIVTKSSIEMGLSWLCLEDAVPGDSLLLVVIGDFDYQSLTKGDWLYYLSQVPVGCKITIIYDSRKPTLRLPFSCTATDTDTTFVEDVTILSEWQRVRANVVVLSADLSQRSEIGIFTQTVMSYLTRNRSPGIREMLCGCCRVLSSKGVRTNIVMSSTRVFDVVMDQISINDWDGVPLGRANPQLKFRYDSSDSVSAASSHSDDVSTFRDSRSDFDHEVREALVRVYSRHNQTKLPLVGRFVSDFRGRYRHLFHILSIKYNNPDILDLYSPAWGS
eukprot:TRINITY_DN17465_c0_g1_i1.p1 TRINITY_DN17465_c0_g1~~TRINITY_DN17465_c0_g1_i1.p1  ORF type:complete len:556 (+),score=65.90 TRINITY_DN17465_c0_g1_i1:149-1816(+)